MAQYHSTLLVEQGMQSNGVPLVGNNDGYFYLDQAKALAHGDNGWSAFIHDPRQSMLLPYFLSVIASFDETSLQYVAAYIGPLLGLSMLLAVVPWGVEVKSPFVVCASALLAVFAPYWIARTHVGFLDTDSLMPGLCFWAMFSVFRLSVATVKRWFWAVSYVVSLLLLWFWWRPGAFLSFGFILCYLIYPCHKKRERTVKIVVGAGIIGFGAFILSGVSPFFKYSQYIIAHFKLAFGGVSGALVSDAIIELRGVTLEALGTKCLGNVWLLIGAVYGTVVYCVRFRWRALFLASTWVFGVAAIITQRFIPLFVPTVAFFSTYGVVVICDWASGKLCSCCSLSAIRARIVLLAVCSPLLLGGVAANVFTYQPKSYFTKNDLMLADKIKNSFPAETLLWTWWDYGYFFKYYSGLEVFFDGGSQTDTTCFIAAYPLVQSDMAVAATWMKYFAVSSSSLPDIGKKEGKETDYLTQLVNKITHAGKHVKRPVALCLPARVYTTSDYLYSFAHIFDASVPPLQNHLELFPKEGFMYDPNLNSVVVPEEIVADGYDSFGSVLDVTGKDPSQYDFARIFDPYLVYSDQTDFLAVTDRAMVGSVLFQLLGLFKDDKQYFEPVYFDYKAGGIWRVNNKIL